MAHTYDVPALEDGYKITLSDEHRALLTQHPALLNPIERQVLYLLEESLKPRQCPACLSVICQLSAAPEGKLDFHGHTPDEDYRCPRCETRLRHLVPLAGRTFFVLHPSEARPVKQ